MHNGLRMGLWTSLHGTISLLIASRIDVKIDRAHLIDGAVAHATCLLDNLPDRHS